MAESVVQIVALAEDLINGVNQFIVIEAFELGFVDIEILGNDAQNVYRFVIAAVGRIENCVLMNNDSYQNACGSSGLLSSVPHHEISFPFS